MYSETDRDAGWKSVLDCIMQEALIKEDIASKQISMVNWSDFSFTNDLIFGICHKDEENNKHFYFMTITPNGGFEVSEKENLLLLIIRHLQMMIKTITRK